MLFRRVIWMFRRVIWPLTSLLVDSPNAERMERQGRPLVPKVGVRGKRGHKRT